MLGQCAAVLAEGKGCAAGAASTSGVMGQDEAFSLACKFNFQTGERGSVWGWGKLGILQGGLVVWL